MSRPRRYAYRKARKTERCEPISEQLAVLKTSLVKQHENLLAIGIGRRQRKGILEPETVVKLVVEGKVSRKKLKRAEVLPVRVAVKTRVYGQIASIWLPTDIEELPVMEPSFDVNQMKATALVTWGTSGQEAVGFITAGHGLPAPGTLIDVQLVNGKGQGRVLERSNLSLTGLDVGLVEVPELALLLDTGPSTPRLISPQALESLVGSKTDDGLSLSARSWAENGLPAMFAVAYYNELPIPTPTGSLVMRHVLHCRSPFGIFTKSRSGGGWVSLNPVGKPQALLAIQSHGSQGSFKQGLGIQFLVALKWIEQQSSAYSNIRWACRKADFREFCS